MATKYEFGPMELEILWEEVRELSLGTSTHVQRLDSPPSPVEFLRNYVTPNKPCIISNAINHWPALSLWSSDEYLCQALGSSEVSVHLTPNGRADSLVPHPVDPRSLCFASAHVERMPFSEAMDLVSNPYKDGDVVAYAQQQNDCFRSEYGGLATDCDSHIDWASEALGSLPEAVNLWIGGELSETSFHKDHYENLYAVVTGEKHFLLLPPTDVNRLYIRPYDAANYCYCKVYLRFQNLSVLHPSWTSLRPSGEDDFFLQDTGKFSLELEDPVTNVPWCSVNPYPAKGTEEKEMEKFPLFFNGPKPFECTVKAGDILYLPSMWFHYVKQSPRTIAVNYWYDMQFDIKYAYFNFLQSTRPTMKPFPGSMFPWD